MSNNNPTIDDIYNALASDDSVAVSHTLNKGWRVELRNTRTNKVTDLRVYLSGTTKARIVALHKNDNSGAVATLRAAGLITN